MMGTGNPVYLLNVERGEQEAAELLDVITERQLADWEGEWVPVLLRAIERFERAGRTVDSCLVDRVEIRCRTYGDNGTVASPTAKIRSTG